MSFLPHVIIGSVVGGSSPNIAVAVAGGVISHLVLDFIPHWDPVDGHNPKPIKPYLKGFYLLLLLIDILLALVVLAFVFHSPRHFWGGVAAAAVDIDNFLQYFKTKNKLFPILSKIGLTAHEAGSRWHSMTNVWFGLFNQSWVTLLGLIILYYQLK